MNQQNDFISEQQARNYELNRILENKMENLRKGDNTSYNYETQMKSMKIDPITFVKIKPRKTQVNKAYMDLFYNDATDKRCFSYTFLPLKYELKEREYIPPTSVYAATNNLTANVDSTYGICKAKGKVNAKKYLGKDRKPQTYKLYYYELRNNYFYFYAEENQLKPDFFVEITEKILDKNLENMENFALDQDLYIKKDEYMEKFRKLIEDKMFVRAFSMVFSVDNQTPQQDILDYLNGAPDCYLDLRKRKNNKTRNSKEYREALFSFLTILLTRAKQRKTNKLQLYLPNTFSYISPLIPSKGNINYLYTNLLPPRSPLIQLHLNGLQHTQMQQFINCLREIFPPLKTYSPRVFKMNKCELGDNNLNRIITQLNWPMQELDFSYNKLTSISVVHTIESAKRLEQKIINLSYNEPLSKIINDSYIKYLEMCPSVKILKLRGCVLVEGVGQWFFQSLKNAMWISEIEIDYLPHYHKYLASNLKDYEAIMSA